MSSLGVTEVGVLLGILLFQVVPVVILILVGLAFWRKLTRIEEQIKEIQGRLEKEK